MRINKQIYILILISIATSFSSLFFLNKIFKKENSLTVRAISNKKENTEKLITSLDIQNKKKEEEKNTENIIKTLEIKDKEVPKKQEIKKKPEKILIKKVQKKINNKNKKDIYTQNYIHQDQIIPFQLQNIYDNTMFKNDSIIQQNGSNGLKRFYYTVYYKNGIEINRKLNNSTVVKQPINKIIKIGTKVVVGNFNYAQSSAILYYTNQERAKFGLPALIWNNNLAVYANIRSKEVSILPDHVRPNGSKYNSINPQIIHGENLISGSHRPLTAQEAVQMWMNSPGHRANILRPQFKSMGGSYYINNGKYKHHWIQLFSVY